MLYVIIGIVFVVAISAFVRKKNTTEEIGEEILVPAQQTENSAGEQRVEPAVEEQIFETKHIAPPISSPRPVEQAPPELPEIVAPPITSPSVSASAMYSKAGNIILPQRSIKKDAYGLHWCNKNSELNMVDFVMKGPMVYWSDGAPGVEEPSCIDIKLPFELPDAESPAQENSESYSAMSPLTRGAYLLWIAGGRNMLPGSALLPRIWFMGVERRVLVDRQDISMCIAEIFKLLPLIRSEKLYEAMRQFAVWACIRILMPEEQIMRVALPLVKIPTEIVCFILSTYSNAKLPLPSYIAFMLMRSSPLADDANIPYSEESLSAFSAMYKSKTNGGLILTTPRPKISIEYIAANESIPKEKRKQDTIEVPNFFSDKEQFSPIVSVWKEFTSNYEREDSKIWNRKDWGAFIQNALEGKEPPLIVALSDIAELMEMDMTERPTAKERKEISETARVEGFMLIPDLCVSGKEYLWSDPVGFSPLAMGEKISDSYSCAAIIFEFGAAILEKKGTNLAALSEIVIGFFSLNEEELTRLGVLAKIMENFTPRPENIGECIQVWIQPEEREFIRNFFFELLTDTKINADRDETLNKLNELLDVRSEPARENFDNPIEMGKKLENILGTLFRNR